MLEPIQDYTDRVFATVLPFYNLRGDEELSTAIATIRSQIMNLHSFDWRKLVAVLDQTALQSADSRNPA